MTQRQRLSAAGAPSPPAHAWHASRTAPVDICPRAADAVSGACERWKASTLPMSSERSQCCPIASSSCSCSDGCESAARSMRRRRRHSSSPRWLARQGSIAALPRHLRAQRRHISTARLPPRYSHADLSVKHQYPRFQRTLRVPQGHPGDGAWVQPEHHPPFHENAAMRRDVADSTQRHEQLTITTRRREAWRVHDRTARERRCQPRLRRVRHRTASPRPRRLDPSCPRPTCRVRRAMHPRLVRRADRRAISHARMEVKDE